MENSAWDRLSVKYDKIWLQKYSLAPTRDRVKELLARIEERETPVKAIFDCGCGTGQLLQELSGLYPGAALYGMDSSPRMVEKAQSRKGGARLFEGDIDSVELSRFISPNSVDVILCTHSFPYYRDKRKALSKFNEILKPGGTAIFIQASVNNLYDRLIMWGVEKTASKAQYLSRERMLALTGEQFENLEVFTIRERFYMPHICGFIVRKRK